IGDDKKSFEMAESAILAPLFGELNGGLLQIAGMLLELAFEALEQRDGVGSGARKADDDFVIVQAPRFASGVLHDVVAHGDLAIGHEDNFGVLAHTQDRSAVHLFALLACEHPVIIPRGDFWNHRSPRRVWVSLNFDSSCHDKENSN